MGIEAQRKEARTMKHALNIADLWMGLWGAYE